MKRNTTKYPLLLLASLSLVLGIDEASAGSSKICYSDATKSEITFESSAQCGDAPALGDPVINCYALILAGVSITPQEAIFGFGKTGYQIVPIDKPQRIEISKCFFVGQSNGVNNYSCLPNQIISNTLPGQIDTIKAQGADCVE
jgi:hypothetical protein